MAHLILRSVSAGEIWPKAVILKARSVSIKIVGVKEIIFLREVLANLKLMACFMGQQHFSVVLSTKRHGSHSG